MLSRLLYLEKEMKNRQRANFKIRKPEKSETEYLLKIADSTGIWQPNEAKQLLGSVLQDYHDQKLGESHEIFVLEGVRSGNAKGWSYFAPTHHADGVWDIWWIGIDGASHSQGLGFTLLAAIEEKILDASGRVIVIETSSKAPLEKARAFYLRQGYVMSGRIANFYGPEDDKIIFAKSLRS